MSLVVDYPGDAADRAVSEYRARRRPSEFGSAYSSIQQGVDEMPQAGSASQAIANLQTQINSILARLAAASGALTGGAVSGSCAGGTLSGTVTGSISVTI